MAIFPSTNLTRTFIGSFFGFAPPYYLSLLCRASGINPWSKYKPIKVGNIQISQAIRDSTSGFMIQNKKIVYVRPDGSQYGPYRIGDFRGYDHNARGASNVKAREYINENANNPGYGPFDAPVAFNYTLPNTDIVKMWANESYTYADILSITDENDILINGSGIDGKAKFLLSGISETNYSFRVGIRLDLSKVYVGSTVTKNYKVWFGRIDELFKFQIPNGDSIQLIVKILAVTPKIYFSFTPLDKFPPNGIVTEKTTVISSHNPNNKTFTITNFRIEGPKKTYPDAKYNVWFGANIGWEFQYAVNDGKTGASKIPYTKFPVNYYGDATQFADSYYAGCNQPFTINNVEAYDEVRVGMQPLPGYYD